MRHSVTSDSLPRLTSQGMVNLTSLLAGHIQKAQDSDVSIFYAEGMFHVTNLTISVEDSAIGVKRKHSNLSKARATLSFEYLPEARACFKAHARRYRYRTSETVIPAEAVYAKDSK